MKPSFEGFGRRSFERKVSTQSSENEERQDAEERKEFQSVSQAVQEILDNKATEVSEQYVELKKAVEQVLDDFAQRQVRGRLEPTKLPAKILSKFHKYPNFIRDAVHLVNTEFSTPISGETVLTAPE